MIVLYTDFGMTGPYLGQMKAAINVYAPAEKVIDLFADAPVHNPRAAAYLLAAYAMSLPRGTIFLCVVDPGVGSAQRDPVVMSIDGRYFVGPGNGLFNVLAWRGNAVNSWRIDWRPEHLSASFHGRDLFAPVAAMLAVGKPFARSFIAPPVRDPEWPDELAEIIYIDHFGNLISGIRAASLDESSSIHYKGEHLPRVRTFSDVTAGQPLCYENSNGLLEIAVNSGRAVDYFSARLGDGLVISVTA